MFFLKKCRFIKKAKQLYDWQNSTRSFMILTGHAKQLRDLLKNGHPFLTGGKKDTQSQHGHRVVSVFRFLKHTPTRDNSYASRLKHS